MLSLKLTQGFVGATNNTSILLLIHTLMCYVLFFSSRSLPRAISLVLYLFDPVLTPSNSLYSVLCCCIDFSVQREVQLSPIGASFGSLLTKLREK